LSFAAIGNVAGWPRIVFNPHAGWLQFMNLQQLLKIFGIGTAICGSAWPVHAVLLESFELPPLADPLHVPANPPYAGIAQSSQAGVTDGSYSMRVDFTDGTFSWLYIAAPSKENSFYQAYGKWFNHNKIKLDVHRPPLDFGWNFALAMALNNNGGWRQYEFLTNWPWLNPGESSTQTLEWDYSAIRATNAPGGNWLQLALAPRGMQGGTVYIDNVRFTDAVSPLGYVFPAENLQGWGSQSWGTALAAAYWDSVDAGNEAGSGSLYCFCDFENAATNQTAVFQVWNVGLDTAEYGKLVFDVKVDGNTSNPSAAGDYGSVQVVLRGNDINWNPLATFPVPASAAAEFVHFELPLYQPLPRDMAGINLIFGGTNLLGPINYYVDNLLFLTETNAPVLAWDPALPGLELSAAAGTPDQRQSIRTISGNYNWTTAGGPVTYAMTINEGLPAQAVGMMAYLHLIGTDNPDPGPAADWDEANGLFLEIQQQANGQCNAALLFKTNAPAGNGNRYTPEGLLTVLSNVPMVGTWSLTLNQANFSLNAPGGAHAAGTIGAAVASQFAGQVFACFGVQPNTSDNLGRYVNLAHVQISGAAATLDEDFTHQNALNAAALVVRATNPDGIQMRPMDVIYRFSWATPPYAYGLQSAAAVNGPWTSPGLPTLAAGSRGIIFLPSTALPAAEAGFFRLEKR